MKKLLLSIFAFLIGCISFSSAYNFSFFNGDVRFISFSDYNFTATFNVDSSLGLFVDSFGFISPYLNSSDDLCFSLYDDSGNLINTGSLIYSGSLTLGSTVGYYYWPINNIIKSGFYLTSSNCPGKSRLSYYLSNKSNNNGSIFLNSFNGFSYISSINYQYVFYDINYTFSSVSSSSDITVFYDYGHSSTSISCNGDNSIYIDGMANVSDQTIFTPFFNISYVDEDNQNVIDSYNKDMLYLQNGQFKKTYTGDNQWILTVQNQGGSTPDIIFTGETLPVVVTGESDNVFSNFGDNALALIYGNIPGFITGAVILFLIFFIIRLFIPKNRR